MSLHVWLTLARTVPQSTFVSRVCKVCGRRYAIDLSDRGGRPVPVDFVCSACRGVPVRQP